MGFSTLHLTLIFLVQNSQNHLFVLFDTMISWPKNTVPRPHLLCIRVSFANVHCRDACYCLNWETCFVACHFLNEGHHSSTWEFWNIPSMVVIKIGTCIGSPKTGNMALLHGRHAKCAWMRWDTLCKRCRPLLQWFFREWQKDGNYGLNSAALPYKYNNIYTAPSRHARRAALHQLGGVLRNLFFGMREMTWPHKRLETYFIRYF